MVTAILLLPADLAAQQAQPRLPASPTPVMTKAPPPIAWQDISATYPLVQPQVSYSIWLSKVNVNPPTQLGYLIWTAEGGWHWRMKTAWTQVEFPPEVRALRTGSTVIASQTACGWTQCIKIPMAWSQSYYVAYPAGVISTTPVRTAQPTATVSLRSLASLTVDARAAPVAVPRGAPVREVDPTPPYAGSWATLFGSQKVELNGGARTLMLEGSELVLRSSAGALIADFPANAHVVRLPNSRVEIWTYVGSKPSGPM
jgi:hypothetical protein